MLCQLHALQARLCDVVALQRRCCSVELAHALALRGFAVARVVGVHAQVAGWKHRAVRAETRWRSLTTIKASRRSLEGHYKPSSARRIKKGAELLRGGGAGQVWLQLPEP